MTEVTRVTGLTPGTETYDMRAGQPVTVVAGAQGHCAVPVVTVRHEDSTTVVTLVTDVTYMARVDSDHNGGTVVTRSPYAMAAPR